MSDFLRIWRTVTTGSSFRDMEKITFTESFIQTQRSDVASVTRFACKQLLQVLQERVRQEKVKALYLVFGRVPSHVSPVDSFLECKP